MAGDDGLGVIALISGGKDSFFSLLHCIRQGHRVVALANLLPASETASTGVQVVDPSASVDLGAGSGAGGDQASDLNSFMYQTVGHEVIPLYAAATGIPLYRQAIQGGALRHELEYDAGEVTPSQGDETESMTSLLREIMRRHRDARAVSAGAILSTYQRTRVESVASRLGLVPLAYLWKYPVLPPPSQAGSADDAQLLRDMARAGLDARLIKVASAGLSEDDLWERVSSTEGADKVKAALRRFGAVGGAVLGEGGEFETIVVDGPPGLFKKSIAVDPQRRHVVNEGGGTTWLMLRDAATLEDKKQEESDPPRVPDMFDARFQTVLDQLTTAPAATKPSTEERVSSSLLKTLQNKSLTPGRLLQWTVFSATDGGGSVEAQTIDIVARIRELLSSNSLDASQISNTVVILRRMADFPKINAEYGKLFTKPNPPSRVTVSCGDLLPADRSIAVYLTVDPSPSRERRGLHVQSRSYWAPANIGPYSQAVGIPVTASVGGGLRSWSVAGQIPLIPSSMELPDPSQEACQQTQIALSLQHLWRIARDLDIQLWTSAVALFARSTSSEEMQRNAVLAGQAWHLAHGSPSDDDDDDDEAAGGPDLWDLKYNPEYMSLAGGGQQKQAETALPDWSVMTLDQQNHSETCTPPVFSVELEELPRQAAVEWQAHVGLSQVDESSVDMLYQTTIQGAHAGWKAWHLVARGVDGAVYLHTTLARIADAPGDAGHVGSDMGAVYEAALQGLKMNGSRGPSPYLAYIDTDMVGSPWSDAAAVSAADGLGWVPCRSIWSADGARLGVIGVYRATIA